MPFNTRSARKLSYAEKTACDALIEIEKMRERKKNSGNDNHQTNKRKPASNNGDEIDASIFGIDCIFIGINEHLSRVDIMCQMV